MYDSSSEFLILPRLKDPIRNPPYTNVHTVQRLMSSKGAKRTILYHITVILQYCCDKTIARSEEMYRDD